jgi:pimeloyl-ACP methyl ester carboxylesterase
MKSVGRLLVAALGSWFVWRLFGPELIPTFRTPQRRPVRVPGRTVFVGENEFFVRETGPEDAPPLVLVHGWTFDSEMAFYELIPPLAGQFRVIVPDHRNHGKSDWIRGHFDVADLADELAGVLDAVGSGPATVVGYSLGGMVAQELARRHPRHVSRLVLLATAARPAPKYRWPLRIGMVFVRAVSRVSMHEMTATSLGVLRRSGSLDPHHERWLWQALLKRDPTLYMEIGASAWRFDSRDWVGRLAVPVCVIITTRDQLVPVAAQYELVGRLPDAEVVELVGARHEAVYNRAHEIVKEIAAFATADEAAT